MSSKTLNKTSGSYQTIGKALAHGIPSPQKLHSWIGKHNHEQCAQGYKSKINRNSRTFAATCEMDKYITLKTSNCLSSLD